ncbi:hypothetical protein [Williamsia serinedens]|uniref:Uncharacterized protein n=1 Tax=Williamsia serinedens TaxID=391736 RepID=A0ABT1GZA6_9NOCA|nr:hypothetical protein [Williamsia serinedens]MCP2159700.1 hypothetical protein [Williamsia serinedens]
MILAAAPTTRTDAPLEPVDVARVLGGCRGPGASVRLQESGLLDLTVLPADGGIAPSTAAEVVRVVAVSHLDLARRVRRSLLANDHAVGDDLVARLLDIALEAGSAAAALHGAVATVRDGRRDSSARRRLGELSVAVSAAEATLAAAGSAVDAVRTCADEPALLRDEAVAAVSTASVLASRAAADTSHALVDLGASGVSDADTDLDVLGGLALTGRISP